MKSKKIFATAFAVLIAIATALPSFSAPLSNSKSSVVQMALSHESTSKKTKEEKKAKREEKKQAHAKKEQEKKQEHSTEKSNTAPKK